MAMNKEELEAMMNSEELSCKLCKGTGKRTDYKGEEKTCYACEGQGTYQNPLKEKDALLKACKGRGEKLRSARPKYDKGVRAYYLWRMARFHGGIDVRLPMCAEMDCAYDPYKPLMELMAESMARRFCGTDMAAAYRWANALGHEVSAPEGLPATAYPCGPEQI